MAHPRLNVLGKSFGKLTILRDAQPREGALGGRGHRRRMVCRCECGREVTLRVEQFADGDWTTCDVCRLGAPRPRRGQRAKDLTGQVFGRLTVLARATTPAIGGNSYWLVRCECGTEKVVQRSSLIKGMTKSCGCWARDSHRISSTKHGQHAIPEYRIWNSMRQRCDNPNNPAYRHYGGRGITYDPTWKEFGKFIEDVGLRPSRELSLDRIDPNGPYTKANCRWATRFQQSQNRTFVNKAEHQAVLAELARYKAKYGELLD